jgi:hypothetical protein
MQFGASMMQLNFQAEGLNEMLGVLKELEKIGSHYSGVELIGMKRTEPELAKRGTTNKDILQWLDEDERQFSRPGPQDIAAIESAFMGEFESQVERAMARAQRAAGSSVKKRFGVRGKLLSSMVAAAKQSVVDFEHSEKWSRQAAGRSLKAAIEEWMRITTSNIEHQTAITPIRPLSPKYFKWKLENYGFTTIGKLTGQLIENLSTAVSAARIRLTSK